MAYVISITDGNGNKTTVEVSYEIYRFEKNYLRQRIRDIKEAENNLSYEGFCELNEEHYMKIPEQLISSSCEAEIINNFSNKELHKAIDKLPEKQRRRLILKYTHGLTLEQIANIENTTLQSIGESIQSAIKNLSHDIGNVEV